VASAIGACEQVLGLDGIEYEGQEAGAISPQPDGATAVDASPDVSTGEGVDGSTADQSSTDAAPVADGPVTMPDGPVTLAQAPGGGAGQGIALDDTRVYWVTAGSNGSVLSVLKDGGGMTTIATGQAYPLDVAVLGTSVYWSVTPAGTGPQCMAMMASTPGSAPDGGDAGPSCVTSSVDVTVRMALGGAGIVLLGQGTGGQANNEFVGVATPGSPFTNVQTDGPSKALAATAQQAFLGNANGDHVDEIALPALSYGTMICTTGCGTAPSADIVLDVSVANVLWITQNGGVFKAPIATSGSTGTQLAQLGGSLTRMARDASYVYVTGLGTSVLAVPLEQAGDAGAYLTLANEETEPFGIAVDEAAVYWANANGTIRTTQLPP
jgi:hypothetical protein